MSQSSSCKVELDEWRDGNLDGSWVSVVASEHEETPAADLHDTWQDRIDVVHVPDDDWITSSNYVSHAIHYKLVKEDDDALIHGVSNDEILPQPLVDIDMFGRHLVDFMDENMGLSPAGEFI